MGEKLKRAARKIEWRIALPAIVCIAILETIALLKGIDGIFFGVAVAAIAGIAGFKISR